MTNARRGMVLVALALALPAAAACSKKDQATAASEEPTSSANAVVEAFTNATIAWVVDAEGHVRAQLRANDGAVLTKDAKGTVEWTQAGERRSAKLVYDPELKALTADGPPPNRDITELKYEVVASGEPLAGTLHVPVGGTAALAADAKLAEGVKAEAVGPHGGVIQVVGEERVEIVSEDDSDEVRVYVLGDDGKVVDVGDRKVTLAVVADSPEVVVLRPGDGGKYFVGTWHVKTDPSRVTVVVRRSSVAHVAIVGWRPGVRLLVVGDARPRVKVMVKGHGHGGDKIDIKADDDHRGGPSMVKVHVKNHGKGGNKTMIKIH